MAIRKITEVYYYSYYYSRRIRWNYEDTVTVNVRGKTFTFKPKFNNPTIAVTQTDPYALIHERKGILAPTTSNIPSPFKLSCSKSSMDSEVTDIVLKNTQKKSGNLNPVYISFYYTYCDGYSYNSSGCGVVWWDRRFNKKGKTTQYAFVFNAREDPQDVSSWTENISSGGGSTGGGSTGGGS